MHFARWSFRLCFALIAPAILLGQSSSTPVAGPDPISDTGELLALANESRVAEGLGPLQWDAALADAAMKHCIRMTAETPIAHRYDGEPDLTTRAAAAGAHFSTIEENLGVARSSGIINKAWLDSPGHRKNLLSPSVDRVGIAVIEYQGLLYAVADYARAVPVLTQAQVEAAFAALLRAQHLLVSRDASNARTYCATSGTYRGNDPPRYVMRWQNPDVTQLPPELIQVLEKASYQKAAVGSCPAQDVNGAFTVYRVAVLLY
jgi:hypothetical protein